jgi:hypothetical protein
MYYNAGQMLLATSSDAIHLKTRGFKIDVMSNISVALPSTTILAPGAWRCELANRGDVAGNICQALRMGAAQPARRRLRRDADVRYVRHGQGAAAGLDV